MLSVMRGHVVLRLVTILTILTFFPSSVGAWTFTDQMREIIVRTEKEFGPLAELPWETVDQLEKGVGNMPWKDPKRFQVAANATGSTNATLAAHFKIDERKTGALFATYYTSPIERFTVADAGNVEDKIATALQDEVMAEIEPATIAIPEDLIEQAIQETQDRFVLAQGEQTDENLPSVAAQLEQEADAILNSDSEAPKPSEEIERFILAQAETGDPWEGATLTAPELLALAQDNLNNDLPAAAALNSIELIDRFSRTIYAVGANTILEGMADEFRKGNYSAQEIAAFEAAMPSFAELQSLDGKYNVMSFHRIKAQNAAKAGQHADGRALLELCISESQTLMEMDPTNPLQFDIMRVFMASAWEYSPTEGFAAADYLKAYLKTQPRNIGRWTAKYVLKKFQGVQGQDMGSARLAAVDLLDFALNDDYVAEAIADPTCYDVVKAGLQYVIADAYVTRNRWQDALDKCNEIIQEYPGATPMVMSAELMKCYVTRRMNSDNLYPAIVAYNDFFHNYPESEYAKDALWMVGNLYFHSEDYTQAATYYRDVITNYPNSAVAIAAADTIEYMNAYLVGTQQAIAEGPEASEPWMIAQMCGPLALQNLLSTQGINVELKELAERTGVNNQGTTMLALVKAAKHYGVTLTGVQLASLESLNFPFIAYVNNDHFVLVRDVNEDQLTIADSWKADEVVLAQEFEKTWNGSALVVGLGPNTADRIEVGLLAANYGGNSEVPPGGGEDESCEGNNNDDPPPPTCTAGQSAAPGGAGGRNKTAPGGPLGIAQISSGAPGSPMSPRGGQTSELGITSPGINARITNNVSALSMSVPDISIDVDGPMLLTFQRNYFSRRGYHVARRSEAEWYGNNIGSGWVHNWNYHLTESEGTEAQGQPSVITIYADDGNTEEYDFVSRTGANDRYEPTNTQLEIEERGNVILRNSTTGKSTLFTVDVLRLYFSAVDGDRIARLESVKDIPGNGNEMTLSYDGVLGTGKLTKIDTPTGDSRYIQLSYSGDQITKAELKKSSTVLQEVVYGYNASDELTKVTDDAGEDIQYAYDSDATYTDSRFITKITDKMGYEYDFSYTFKTHPTLTSYGFAYVIDVNYPNGLKTTYDRSNSGGGIVTVTNWDSTTLLNKTVYTPGGTFFKMQKIDLYRDATTYERWEFKYDNHVMTKILRPGGSEYATYTYNSRGQWSTNSNEDLSVTWEYDANELRYPTKRIEADGTETEYFYDSDERVTKVTHPSVAAAGWVTEYDAQGNQTKEIDPAGNTFVASFDALGLLTSQSNPLNHTTSFEYDDNERLTKITDPLGHSASHFYGSVGCLPCGGGQLTKVTNADGVDINFEYDLNGQRTKTVDDLSNETKYEYDEQNRMTKAISPLGASVSTTLEYDLLGFNTKVTDFAGTITTYAYDMRGRMTKKAGSGPDLEFAYNDADGLTQYTDGESRARTFNFDSNNRLSYFQDDELVTDNREYDSFGRLTKIHSGLLGDVDPIIYDYNNVTGLQTKLRYVSGSATHTTSNHYDMSGALTKVSDWMGGNGIRYEYNDARQLTKIKDHDDSTLSYSYDSAGRITSMNDYNGNVVSYTYTDANKISTVTAPGSKKWTYTYDEVGAKSELEYPNGMKSIYHYDNGRRLTKVEHKDGVTVKSRFLANYDDQGRVTKQTFVDDSYWEYWYDISQEMTKAERRDDLGGLLHRYTCAYDDSGSLVTKDIYDGTVTTTTVYGYDAANRMTKDGAVDIEYDASGRKTKRKQDTTYEATYTYRYGDKLYDVTSDFPGEDDVTFEYDGDLKMREVSGGGTTTHLKRGADWSVLSLENGSGTLQRTYINGLADVDGTNPATGSYRYFFASEFGSRELFDQSKSNIAGYEIAPDGEEYSSFGTEPSDPILSAANAEGDGGSKKGGRCGPKFAERWTPQGCLGMSPSLQECCSHHDCCYGCWHPRRFSRKECDSQMKCCVDKLCAGITPWIRYIGCTTCGFIYWLLVRLFAVLSYKNCDTRRNWPRPDDQRGKGCPKGGTYTRPRLGCGPIIIAWPWPVSADPSGGTCE